MAALESATAVTIAGAFVFGMLLVLLESLRTVLEKRLHLSAARVDWLLAALNITLIPMMLVSGVFCDRFGAKPVLLGGSLGLVVAMAWLALSETALPALGAILLAGVGGACLSTGSSVLMKQAFFPDNEPASQNLGNVFFGLGALMTPALIAALLRRLDYRRAIGVVALLCLLPGMIAALTGQSAFDPGADSLDLGRVLYNPILWLAGLMLLLYAPLEGSLSMWATQYLTDRGFPERAADWLLSGFWSMFLAARLATALLQEHGSLPSSYTAAWLILILALVAAVFLGNMAGGRTRLSGALGLVLIGAFFGPIFPTLVGVLFLHFPRERGTAFGAMFAIGAVGNLILPPLIGAYVRRTSVQRALIIPMVMVLLLALVTLVFGLGQSLFKAE